MKSEKQDTEKYRRIIRDREDRVDATNHVAHLTGDPLMEVTIKPYKKNRSLAQNRLMWGWHTEYGEEFGMTKEDAHDRFKRKHVLPILLRDDEDGGLTAVFQNSLGNKEAMDGLLTIISSTLLDTKQFTDALEEYDRVTAAEEGLAFTHPQDIYYEAIMGRLPDA